MPTPIRPVNDSFSMLNQGDQGSGSTMFNLDLDALAAAVATGGLGKSSSLSAKAEATDKDAELLLELFNNGEIVVEAENTEDKKYAVPKSFSNDQLMRLKAASLVHGDSSIIKFTSKAVRVIKTLVLAEQNAYSKSAVKKPYSMILAENRAKSSSMSTLAFQKNASAAPPAPSTEEIIDGLSKMDFETFAEKMGN